MQGLSIERIRGPYATFYPRFHMYATQCILTTLHIYHIVIKFFFFPLPIDSLMHSEKCKAHGYNGMNTRMTISYIFRMLNSRFGTSVTIWAMCIVREHLSHLNGFRIICVCIVCIFLESPLGHCLVPVMNYIIESTRKLANGTAQCKNKPILINVHECKKKIKTYT